MHSPWPNSRQETGGSATDTQNKIRYKLDNKISCEQRRTGQEYNNITPAPYTSSHCAVPGSIINNDLFTFSLCRERVAVIVSGSYTQAWGTPLAALLSCGQF